jgi:hypothetical protein
MAIRAHDDRDNQSSAILDPNPLGDAARYYRFRRGSF